MIPFRINARIEGEEVAYYTRAENSQQAVGKFLIELKDSELVDPDIISLYRKIISEAVIDTEEDILTYDSDSIRIFCSKSRIILPEEPGDEYTDSVSYTYLNLPPHLKHMSEFDVEWILCIRYEYLENHSIILDEDDGRQYYSIKDAAEYIYRELAENEYELPLDKIEGVLRTAHEYDMASADYTEEMIFLDAIDISSINPN